MNVEESLWQTFYNTNYGRMIKHLLIVLGPAVAQW